MSYVKFKAHAPQHKEGAETRESGGFPGNGEHCAVTVVARNFAYVTIRHSRIRGLLKGKQVGSKRFLQKSTSVTRNMQTASNCRTDSPRVLNDVLQAGPNFRVRPFACLGFTGHRSR